MSTALAHDYLLLMRGAERTFAEIAACFPNAPIYTLLYDSEGTEGRFADREITTSYLQALGVRQKGFRRLLPLFPGAAGRLRADGARLLVSSSSAFAHGVAADAEATHVCYCHTPFRYAWFERERALREVPRLLRPALRRTLDRMREWDLAASHSVDHCIANSELTRRRIQEIWKREASVVHPPVDVERFKPGEPEDFFLAVTELVPHKRVELALEAARRARRRIKVVGTGPEMERLRANYGSSAEFLGRVDDRELAELYARSLALVVPNVEEFGICAVESQAAGRPVLAAGAGGVRETVVDGETGVLVEPANPDAMAEAMAEVDFTRFSPQRITEQAARFSAKAFRERLLAEVSRVAGGLAAGAIPARETETLAVARRRHDLHGEDAPVRYAQPDRPG